MRNIRLVVSDIDGTLIQKDEDFSPRIIELSEALRRQGILFTFASGRLPCRINPYLTLMGNDIPAVACNGALVYCENKIISKHCMPARPLHTLIIHANELNMTVLYAIDGVEYCLCETPYVKIKRAERGSYYPLRPISEEEWKSLQLIKMNIICDSGFNSTNVLKNDLDVLQHDFSVTHYGSSGLEIVRGGVNKSGGVAELCRYLNISIDQVMAIGDNENDCKMLKDAGIGAAVANADFQAKACADYVCHNDGADGVYEAVKKFCLPEGRDS